MSDNPIVIVEYLLLRDTDTDELWIEIQVDGDRYDLLGPFDSENERRLAFEDMKKMSKSLGAEDIPLIRQ